MEMSIRSNILFGGSHFENGSITGKRGISRNVSPKKWILLLKIYRKANFQKRSIKTLTPNEFSKSSLVYGVGGKEDGRQAGRQVGREGGRDGWR